jgi:hypothetical protein
MSSLDDQIVCPHCRAALTLPAQLYVQREVHRGKGGYIAFGDPERNLACQRCGRGIKVADILAGKHDPKPPGLGATLLGYALLGALVLGLLKMCSR